MAKSLIKKIVMYTLIAIAIALMFKVGWTIHVKKYTMNIDENGLKILNDYEFPNYLIENDNCMRPYDVGDGVITFGPGITYPTEEEGIRDINNRFDKKYTVDNNCINLEILYNLQMEIIGEYENVVNKIAINNFRQFTQDQFNGLVLLAYNSPNLFKYKPFKKAILSNNTTQDEYIEHANDYYKQLTSYYDNPNTDTKNDGYGRGWYNRIVDSSEVYFGIDYEYQNNAL